MKILMVLFIASLTFQVPVENDASKKPGSTTVTEKDVEDFFRKVEAIQRRGVLLYVGYVAVPESFDRIREYKRRLDDMGVPFILNEYNGAPEGLPFPQAYTDEQRAFLKQHFWCRHYYDMLVERHNPGGKRCLAGYRYI